MKWTDDWLRAKRNLLRWWHGDDLAVCLFDTQIGPGQPNAGHARWHDLLKCIKVGGKGVQVGCYPDQIIPLLDAIGPEGTFITCSADSGRQVDDLLARVDAYRTTPIEREVAL